MSAAPDFEVVPLAEVAMDRILPVLVDAFGRNGDPSWYRWKHLEGPWGPSQGWVAQDDAGILGVLCCIPWPLEVDGRRVVASRLVDGGTTPRSRRRGVFSTLVQHELAAVRRATWPLAFGTATPEAAAAHVRNGATVLAPLEHRYGVPKLRRPSGLERGWVGLDQVTPVPGPVATSWDALSMRWRLDPRSGHAYEVATLAQADRPCGAVFRLLRRRGVRTIVLTHAWGPTRERAQLLTSLAAAERAVTILAPASGSQTEGWRTLLHRGASQLCVWDLRDHQDGPDLLQLNTWALTGADLEGVV